MTAIAHHPHRVSSAVADARAAIGSVAGVPLWSLDATETTAALTDITRAEAQLAELKARLLTHAERIDIAAASAASSTATWHAVATNTTRAAAHRLMWTAQGLEVHDPTRAALAAGRINTEQAEVILR